MGIEYKDQSPLRIEHIWEYCVLAQCNNLSDAARRVGVSQQTLSRILDDIESELGCKLVDRTRGSKTISLTPEGRIFYKRGFEMLDLWHRTCADLKGVHGQPRTLVLDCIHRPLVLGQFQAALSNLRNEGSDFASSWLTGTNKDPIDCLREGDSDVFFGLHSDNFDMHGLASSELFQDDAMLMMSVGNPFAGSSSIPVAKLRGIRLMQPFGARYGASTWCFHDICHAEGFAPKLRSGATEDEMSALLGFVSDDDGCYIVPRTLVGYYSSFVPGSAFVPLTGKHAHIEVRAYWREDEEPATLVVILQLVEAMTDPMG